MYSIELPQMMNFANEIGVPETPAGALVWRAAYSPVRSA